MAGCEDPDNDLEVGGSSTGCNTGAGSFIAAGDGAWSTNSSIDFKENIRPLFYKSDQEYLTLISSISPVMADYKEQISQKFEIIGKTTYPVLVERIIPKRVDVPTFIAEDWNKILHNGTEKQINWTEVMLVNYKINQILTKKLLFLQEKINDLEKRIQNLESSK